MMTKVWPRIRITGVCRQVAGAVLMVLGGAVLPNTLSASEQGATLEPYVLRAPDNNRTAVGLVYTPSVLQALTAAKHTNDVAPRIADALRRQAAIVVMWRIPGMTGTTEERNGYKMAIVGRNAGGPASNPNAIQPMWTVQDAKLLSSLDGRPELGGVGAMAAFPVSALSSGSRVYIYTEVPTDRAVRVDSRYGVIDSGMASDSY
jgi:hypothetical protein